MQKKKTLARRKTRPATPEAPLAGAETVFHRETSICGHTAVPGRGSKHTGPLPPPILTCPPFARSRSRGPRPFPRPPRSRLAAIPSMPPPPLFLACLNMSTILWGFVGVAPWPGSSRPMQISVSSIHCCQEKSRGDAGCAGAGGGARAIGCVVVDRDYA